MFPCSLPCFSHGQLKLTKNANRAATEGARYGVAISSLPLLFHFFGVLLDGCLSHSTPLFFVRCIASLWSIPLCIQSTSVSLFLIYFSSSFFFPSSLFISLSLSSFLAFMSFISSLSLSLFRFLNVCIFLCVTLLSQNPQRSR